MLKNKFAIIGIGVVGTALAVLLERAGLECVGVHARSPKSYQNFCRYLNKEQLSLQELSLQADILFITTQDGAIAKVADQLTLLENRKEPQTWIHCSGSLQAEVMRKSSSLQVNYLSMHPLQAFAKVDNALVLIKGTHFGIEGSNPESEQIGEELVRLLGGIPHKIDSEKKTLYHAGAVVASNYMVSLLYMAGRLFEEAGIKNEEAIQSLLPLMAGTYKNIAQIGLPCALTGPIARGDAEVVAKHLHEMPDDLRETYQGLGRLALELGKQKKRILETDYTRAELESLEQLLKEGMK